MNLNKPANRKDVAQEANVAASTVSLVLNNTPNIRVSESTRKRIQQAAKKLDYKTSSVAAGLKTGKTSNISVIIHYTEKPFNTYINEVLEKIWDRAMENNYRLLFSKGTADKPVDGLFNRKSADGFIIINSPYHSADQEFDTLLNSNTPIALIGSHPKAYDQSYIGIDDEEAGFKATEELIKYGHKKILLLTGPTAANSSAVMRLKGYRNALKHYNIPFDQQLVHDGSYNACKASEIMEIILRKNIPFTGIFSSNYPMAQGAVNALHNADLNIHDISITTIDSPTGPPLPQGLSLWHLKQPNISIGEVAITSIFKQLRDKKRCEGKSYVDYTIETGNSVKRPKQ